MHAYDTILISEDTRTMNEFIQVEKHRKIMWTQTKQERMRTSNNGNKNPNMHLEDKTQITQHNEVTYIEIPSNQT